MKKDVVVVISKCLKDNRDKSSFCLNGFWKGNQIRRLIVYNKLKLKPFIKGESYVLYLLVNKYNNETIFSELIRYNLIE